MTAAVMPDLTEDPDIKRQTAVLMNLLEDKARDLGCEIEAFVVTWIAALGDQCAAEMLSFGDTSLPCAEMLALNLVNAADRKNVRMERVN